MRENSPKKLGPDGMPGGAHEVMAQEQNKRIPLGFFCFVRGLNGEVISKEYYTEELPNGEKVTKVFKRIPDLERSQLCYPDQIQHLDSGEPFKMTSMESVYLIKRYTQHQ